MSDIRANTISDAAGTGPITLTKQSAAKAWVYEQSGTVLVESFNISSITDNATGEYGHNLTSAMVSTDGNISMPICRTSDDRSASVIINSASQFTSYARDISSSGAMEDSYMLAVTHGDLA